MAISDEPYSRLDGLFRPSLHSLTFVVPPDSGFHFGVALNGGDQLDLVRWSIAGFMEASSRKVSATGGLLFNDLAPWQIQIAGQRYHYTTVRAATNDDPEDREWRVGSASIARTWRGTYDLTLGGTYNSYRREQQILRLWGPVASVGYTAVERTLYTGPRRGLAIALDGAWYPRPAGDMRDGRTQLDVYIPVPGTRRHVLHATVRNRWVVGAPRPILQLGGFPPGAPLYSSPTEDLEGAPFPDDIMPLGVRFTEPLRGFEDLGFEIEATTIGDLSWTYPLIIDRGLATMLFLPAGFARQLDLELFASVAQIKPDPTTDRVHAAGGGALTLRLVFMRLPFFVRYQIAQRFTDDRGWLQLAGLGTDL